MKKNDRILVLQKAAEAMARGDFTPDIPVGDDEIGHLGKSLKALSDYLQRQSERTQSLYRIMLECNLNLHLIDVLNHIFESFKQHLSYDRITLALLESEGNKLKLHWSRACYQRLVLNIGQSIPMSDKALQAILNSREMLIINDLNSHLEGFPASRLTQAIFREGIRSCLICPLLATGKVLGFVFFSSRKKNVFKDSNLYQGLPLQIASQLSALIEKTQLYRGVKQNKQLIAQKRSLEQRVTHDVLTGLLNRMAIFDILHKQIQRAKRGGYGIAVIMIDIDHFKNINDTYGHLAGDAVLCEIAGRLSQSARAHEYIGRYGGEEFLAIISPYDRDGAIKAAERLRAAVACEAIQADHSLIPVTISLGVAIGSIPDILDANLLLRRADKALYSAKHRGRNRVEIASENSAEERCVNSPEK